MKIIVFSNAKTVSGTFNKIEKKGDWFIEYHAFDEMKKMLKTIPVKSLVYVDAGTMKMPEIRKVLIQLEKQEGCRFGFLDPKGSVADVAEIFHRGGVDYIGKQECKDGIDAKRMKRVLEFIAAGSGETEEEVGTTEIIPGLIPSGPDWRSIKSGNEYTFSFMFIELDNQRELKKNYGADNLKVVVQKFHDIINSIIAPVHGKIWIWMDFGGLILFPFNGEKSDAVLTSFSIMLNRRLINAEDMDHDLLLSYRIALHIGNTIYETRGDTGELISDTINSIFHLGQKYAEPGNLYLTAEMQPFIPRGLEKSFIPAGTYEGREIFRMRHVL
ncbi:MAG: hypothetical protein CVV44_07675 [Spirochaetae bacterium HGW-Spirochaetae-1]|jgi:hypothetical protein|nr:MAG: hypothetical protein CVV44_07675 [Spirochaetae bacterium HGW-Spirochaetae-1]